MKAIIYMSRVRKRKLTDIYNVYTGFRHASFTFGHESLVHKTNINGKEVPPGSLISFLQKGIQYMEVEAKLRNKVRRNDRYKIRFFGGLLPDPFDH